MPITPTYPGVYIEEIASGVRTITGVSTSITAFVGYTARGPVNKAKRIFNFGDFERKFGGLHPESEIGYAVQQFFLNGGTDAYVVRVAKGAKEAQIKLKDINGKEVLTVSAVDPGVWGNNLRLDIDYATTNPESTFNLGVTQYQLQDTKFIPVAKEQYRNLSMNSRSSSYAVNVVKGGSKLIRLKRTESLSFASGYSMSGNLASFPTLTTEDKTIAGILDGTRVFTLVLADPVAINSAPDKMAALVTAVNAAITTAGLSTSNDMSAKRVNGFGADDASGNYLQLISHNSNPEYSSVQVTIAGSLDASDKLKLGLENGGREKEGASSRRPAQTGTTSADLANLLGTNTTVSGNIDINIVDNATGLTVCQALNQPLPATSLLAGGTTLRDNLQQLIRNIDHPATKNAIVQLNGTVLRVLASTSETPNASIAFTDAAATAILLDAGSGALVNVQEYSLGTGTGFGFQTGAVLGSDGTEPGAGEFLGSAADKTGIHALRDVDLFNLLVIPRTAKLGGATASVIAAAAALCEERRAFFLIDPEPTKTLADIADWADSVSKSRNAAVFFPMIQIADPLDGFRLKDMPPSGAIAGIFARTDSERGVWKAPAGTEAVIRGVLGLSYTLTDPENGVLNPLGVNCLRTFPVYGTVVWGSRTRRGADQLTDEYKYIPVRRLVLFIEESLYRGTKWVVFEPNDEPLWSQIRLNIGAFMNNLFRQGAFQGKTPREAYFVKCDRETTTQNDINLGIVNIVVGFAPLKPAEFVIIKIQQMAGQIVT
jgi:hypothetical protein